jgi:hypothetical protein
LSHDRIEHLETVHPGHRQVENDGVGAPALQVPDEILAARRGAHELDVRLVAQQVGHRLPDERGIVGQGDANPAHDPTLR